MKRMLLGLAGLLLAIYPLNAQQRTLAEAESEALQFLTSHTEGREEVTLNPVAGNLLELELGLRRKSCPGSRKDAPSVSFADANAQPYYVFAADEGGFVIVSGDRRMTPVIGFSATGTLDLAHLPDGLCEVLDEYAWVYELTCSGKKVWKQAVREWETVAPFVTTKWDQVTPYNNYCPTSGGTHALTGCGATAMAQAMAFYHYPPQGIGSFSYTSYTKKWQLSSDFSAHQYAWTSMRDKYTSGGYTPAQARAVAELMYDCGVSVGMDYGLNWSSSYVNDISYALINNFGYNPNVVTYISNYHTTSDWEAILHEELEATRPVIYRGGDVNDENGHIFLLDGYQNGYFHVNWGWSGSCDGWFELNNLFVDKDYDYRYGHWMVCRISPETVGGHEDVFYADRFYANQESYTLSDNIVFYIENVWNYSSATAPRDSLLTMAGQLGVGLYDLQDRFVGLQASFNFSGLRCWWGWSQAWFRSSLYSLNLQEGDVLVFRPIVINTAGEVTPVRTSGGESDRLYATVEGNRLYLSADAPVGVRSPKEDGTGFPYSTSGTYTLGGQRMTAKPTLPGIYVHQGRKVLVR